MAKDDSGWDGEELAVRVFPAEKLADGCARRCRRGRLSGPGFDSPHLHYRQPCAVLEACSEEDLSDVVTQLGQRQPGDYHQPRPADPDDRS